MTNQPEPKPTEQDAILGGDVPAPAKAAVLGGMGQVQQRLNDAELSVKFVAMKDCLNYGSEGISHIVQALQDPLPRTQYEAYRLLKGRSDSLAKEALKHHRFWTHFEKLDGLPNRHAQMFANRQVENFETSLPTHNLATKAFGIRQYRQSWNQQQYEETADTKLSRLLQSEQARFVEALVFGFSGWYSNELIETLAQSRDRLPQLTALFVGDIEDQEMMISDLSQGDLSDVLDVCPQLEILRVRGSVHLPLDNQNGQRDSKIRHENLLALTLENSGLSRETVNNLCRLELPALEYLELWLGSPGCGGTSSIEDLMPIVSGEVFPNLKYLGLRNCEYADDIAINLARSLPRTSLIELDLSMGTLSETGVESLLSSHIVSGIDVLDVSQTCLSRELAPQYFAELDCLVLYDRLQYQSDPKERGCIVRE